jgi:glucose-1-phosphate cytidylyltransferase
MKVVLFCGGQGTRIREYSSQIPKPLVPIGGAPILLHMMQYYASFGHKDFILCLGYKGEAIKRFFLDFIEDASRDIVHEFGLTKTGGVNPLHPDWRITFVETGSDTNIGGRLLRVRKHLEGEEMFCANYADILTDLNLDEMLAGARATGAIASFCCVPPPYSFHTVSFGAHDMVTGLTEMKQSGAWMNGGYMILRQEIFENLNPGEELVEEGFARLIRQNRLYAHKHSGFWMPMDTFKEKQAFDDMIARGHMPWRRPGDPKAGEDRAVA